MRLKVTSEEKEELLKHCNAINDIFKKYPWFEPGKSCFVTSMNRCKSAAEGLLRHVTTLPTKEDSK